MQFGVISLMLAVTAFVGILLWTFNKSKKKDFEEASRIPLEDGDDSEFNIKSKTKIKKIKQAEHKVWQILEWQILLVNFGIGLLLLAPSAALFIARYYW
jgi:Cbb3-type cytochrome oxidase component FixQ.